MYYVNTLFLGQPCECSFIGSLSVWSITTHLTTQLYELGVTATSEWSLSINFWSRTMLNPHFQSLHRSADTKSLHSNLLVCDPKLPLWPFALLHSPFFFLIKISPEKELQPWVFKKLSPPYTQHPHNSTHSM